MSALGQKRTFREVEAMSALPPKADIGTGPLGRGSRTTSRLPVLRRTTAAGSGGLFDHLVGSGEQRRRNVDAKRLRSLEIDHQLEFCRLLDR